MSACCGSCAAGGPCSGSRALARRPTDRTLGRGLVHSIRMDVGGAHADVQVYDRGDRFLIPVDVTLPQGGFLRGGFEIDRRSFLAALAAAQSFGGVPRLAELVERAVGSRPTFYDTRPLLGR